MTALLPPPAQPVPAPPRQTSVPVWPADPPALDPTGVAYLLVGIGPDAGCVVDRWAVEAAAHGRPCSVWTLASAEVPGRDDEVQAAVARWLGGFCVGARLVVCGPEADVLAVAACARRLGVVPEEVTTSAVTQDRISMFCVHCETTARLVAAPGWEVPCPGCHRRLEVHEHVSGHRGSYLASAVARPEVDR